MALISFNCLSQNPYYDAISIANTIKVSPTGISNISQLEIDDSTELNYVAEILSNYVSNSAKETLLNFTEGRKIDSLLTAEFEKNPFFIIASTLQADKMGNSLSLKGLSSSFSSIGGLDVATFADEFSQFLIDRAKQELNIAFFNRMKKFFDKTPEIQVLFPKTTDALTNLLSYEYPTMIKTLRNVFYEDLKNVFFKVDDVFKLPKYRPLIKDFPEIILSLKTIQIIAEIDNERHPSDIIGDFKNIPEWNEYRDDLSMGLFNFHAVFQIGHLFSESVRFTPFGSPFELVNMDNDNVIVQLDTAIAIAKKEKIYSYRIDTIKSESLDDLISNVKKQIRTHFDESKIETDSEYLKFFLKNLFGDHNFAKADTLSATSTEELIFKTDQLIRTQESLYRNDFTYEINGIIRKYSPNRAWVTRQHLNYLIQDTTAFKIYAGLLYQKSRIEDIRLRVKVDSILTSEWELKYDLVLLPGSILKKDSKIEIGSRLNDNKYDTTVNLINDLVISERSVLIKGCELKSESLTKYEKTRYFHNIIASHADELYLIRDYLVEFIQSAEKVDKVYNELQEQQRKNIKPTKEEFYEYISVGIKIIENSINIPLLMKDSLKFEPYLKIARNGNDMYRNIYQKEYTAAINNLVNILGTISRDMRRDSENIDELKLILKTYKESKPLIKSEIEKQKNLSKYSIYEVAETTSKILKYGTFMANIVQSDSSEQIRAVIEAAALPVGSYSIKRASRWNVSLNAYLGGYYGNETLDTEPLVLEAKSTTFGVIAPIGIAGSYGSKAGSFSIYLSLIDLGAFASFRLQTVSMDSTIATGPGMMDTTKIKVTDEANILPEVTFENIFAPGAYFVYGIPGFPISIGGGVQRGPQLRKITTTAVIIDTNEQVNVNRAEFKSSAWRLSVFVAVDIPLVNFYTRSR